MASLPPFAPFPKAVWRQHLTPQEWDALIDAWIALSHALLNLPEKQLKGAISNDESIAAFLTTFAAETAISGTAALGSRSTQLLKAVFQLTSRIFSSSPPAQLLEFSFLADVARIYPRKLSSPLISRLFQQHTSAVESSLSSLKKLLIPQLDAGIKGDLKLVERELSRLTSLLHVSPDACTLFLAGSDFFDGLVTCYRVMNPPLRKVIIATTYLCLIGLVDAEPPKWAMLSDELYALKSAADAHKAGPLNANDSLVPELVTSTPLLKVLLRRAEGSGAGTDGLKNRISALEGFKKGAMHRPKRLVKRKIDKGKGKETHEDAEAEIHMHQMSLITQIQDLFPDLGSGFISKCLDEYGEDVEQVVANLLGETLPPHLANADRTEQLSLQPETQRHTDLAPHSTPPTARHNVYDDDEFDRLAVDVSKISFGKRPAATAEDILEDKSNAPNKAAILSALAAFDSDDDERDDTYDADDVGGTVDATNNEEADAAGDVNEEALFRAYQMDASVFERNSDIRKSSQRTKLKAETGMTDEALEGWAVMLARNPQQKRRLEAKYAFSGQQAQLERTSWRATPTGSGAEDSDADRGASRGGRGGRGRGRGQGRGGRGGGNVAGPTGEKETESARKNKEAHKGSRANHNRRDARAKKMARGGFAP